MTAKEIINYKISMMNIVDDQRFTYEEKKLFLSKMFIILKKMEDRQIEPISNDFTVAFDKKMKTFFVNPTIPNLHFGQIDTFVTISRKLERNIAITEKEANIFLSSICALTKINIYNSKMIIDNNQIQTDDYSYEEQCSLGSQILLYHLKKLGLEVFGFDITVIIPSPFHDVIVVNIPINTGEKEMAKTYLLDCTYRQFFTIFDCNLGWNPSVGYYMGLDEEKRQFADQLLKNGFFELNKENIKLYLDGFYLASQGKSCFNYSENKLEKDIYYTSDCYLKLIEKIDIFAHLDIDKLIDYRVILDYFDYEKLGQLIGTYYNFSYENEKRLRK